MIALLTSLLINKEPSAEKLSIFNFYGNNRKSNTNENKRAWTRLSGLWTDWMTWTLSLLQQHTNRNCNGNVYICCCCSFVCVWCLYLITLLIQPYSDFNFEFFRIEIAAVVTLAFSELNVNKNKTPTTKHSEWIKYTYAHVECTNVFILLIKKVTPLLRNPHLLERFLIRITPHRPLHCTTNLHMHTHINVVV